MKNFYKFLILLLIFIFSVGAVSAQDLNQTAPVCIENGNEVDIDDAILLSDSSVKSFDDLNETISDPAIGEFDITDNYEYGENDGNYSKGIFIKKDNFVINGNNHEIDAKNKNRIFNIEGPNIIINNLVLKNGINQALFITGKISLQTM